MSKLLCWLLGHDFIDPHVVLNDEGKYSHVDAFCARCQQRFNVIYNPATGEYDKQREEMLK